MEQGVCNSCKTCATCWLILFTMFKAVEGLGADNCLMASWIFISEQGDEMASDEQEL